MSDDRNLSQQAADATRNWTNDKLQNWSADHSGAYNYSRSDGGGGAVGGDSGVPLGAGAIVTILAGLLGLLLAGLVGMAIFAAGAAAAGFLLKFVFKGLGVAIAEFFGMLRGLPLWVIVGGAVGCGAGAALAAWVDGPTMTGVVRLGLVGALIGAIAWMAMKAVRRKR